MIKRLKTFILLINIIFLAQSALAFGVRTEVPEYKIFLEDDSVLEYINIISKKHSIDKEKLTSYFAEAKYEPAAINLMNRPAESLDWNVYMERVLTKARIQNGAGYYKENRLKLKEAEKRFGVPANVIAGIIGVETNFGLYPMKYRAFDVIATLAFTYPRRSAYFKNELTELILFSEKMGESPFKYLSSYAGAIGIPQFMPTSINQYSASGRGDKDNIDIVSSHDDAIFSVANFLHKHGWRTGEPLSVKVSVYGDMFREYITQTPCSSEKIPVRILKRDGVEFPMGFTYDKGLAGSLIEIIHRDNATENDYYVVFSNFCVVQRYNPSHRYAIAVNHLGIFLANYAEKEEKENKVATKKNKSNSKKKKQL